MGKLNDSLLSGSYGRTGRLVVANMGGVEILKVRPRKRTAEPSPKQALVQSRMRRSYDFLLSYKLYACKHFGMPLGMRSRFNLAMENVISAFKIDYAGMVITPEFEEIEFSRGNLLSAVPSALTAPAAASFMVEWFDNSAGDAERETDQLQLVYFAENGAKSVFLENAAQRQDGTFTVSVAPNLSGRTVHVWMAFRDTEKLSVSSSVYVGSIPVT